MKNEFRYGDIEFRQSDDGLGVVVGTVIRYGDVAKIGGLLRNSRRRSQALDDVRH